jgi:putative hydrolase of the HAD superfamily
MQMSAVNQTKLTTYFQTLLISGDPDVHCRKPDVGIFKLACSRLNIQAQETLMIGDNPLSDCKGALNAGLSSIQIGMRKPRLAKVKRVTHLLELHDFLKTLF